MTAFPDETPVHVWHPLRGQWQWLPGTVLERVSAGTWRVVVEVDELATLADGRPARPGTPRHRMFYLTCHRTEQGIRRRNPDIPDITHNGGW